MVTFHLGLMEDVLLHLTVTVEPLRPGEITNTVRIRGNEREQSLANNTSSLSTQVEGPIIPQSLHSVGTQSSVTLSLGVDGLPEIELQGEIGATYSLESSADLVTWTPLVEFVSTTPRTQVTGLGRRGDVKFYRAVRKSVNQ